MYTYIGIALLDGLKLDLITYPHPGGAGRDDLRKQIQDARVQAFEGGGRGHWQKLHDTLQLLETCVELDAMSCGYDRGRFFLFVFVQWCVCVCVCACVCACICARLRVCVDVCMLCSHSWCSGRRTKYLPICLSVCLSVYVSVCLSIYLCICLSSVC